jgi:hypothetical protein
MQNESLEVAVTDLAGKKVYSGPLSADETVKQFDFSYLKSGVYVMIFNDKGIIVTKKFIKR